ncbi:MAG TPA: alpha/beta hydrolase-fold protein [Ktedonobacteraceae bacterium]
MKPSTTHSQIPFSLHQKRSILLFLISLAIALMSGILLFNPAVIGNVSSAIIGVGLDPLRAQLIAALLLTLATAFLGAAFGRRKLGAILGAWIIFSFGYLNGFIQLEMQPTYDPGGLLEPLDMGALIHTSITMTALALLCAFCGAAIGVTLSEVLLDPLYRLVQSVWDRYSHKEEETQQLYAATSQTTAFTTIGAWLVAIAMIGLIVLASSATELFIYSPDTGLHTVPYIVKPAITPTGTSTEVGTIPSFGTIVTDSLVSPTLGGQKRTIVVYLPPTYNSHIGQNKRYPVLYLLHGSPGQAHDWFTAGKADQSADTLIALGKIPELIMVLPDGNGRPGATSEWANSYDQRQLIESYVVNDVVKYIDSKYRTIPDAANRAIGGLSMGGFGAMNIAVHHPDIFGSVISLGGYYYAEGGIWGNNAVYMQQNSPADVLLAKKQAWKLLFFLGAGTQDQPYYTDTQQFAQELDALHIPYHLDIQKGYHSWTIWQTQMYNALLWLHWGQ